MEGGDSMTVKTILSRKGRNVVTIEPSATLQAAIATLVEHRIGAVVVLGADRRVIGLLSERDVVRAFAAFGADASCETTVACFFDAPIAGATVASP